MFYSYDKSTFVLFVIGSLFLVVKGLHPEVDLNFQERVTRHGYDSEFHPLITEDDYIITLYRIPHGLEETENTPRNKNKSAILMVHGMGGSGFNFINLGPKIAPAYYFADRGFDVWIMCARGVNCQNAKNHHKSLNWDKNKEYWIFSKQEIGYYDIAASIDHIVNVTGQQSVFYIGHSAGSPEILVLLSERPEYNKKIKIACHWGGGVMLKDMQYPLAKFASHLLCTPSMKNFFMNTMGLTEAFPLGLHKLIASLSRVMCADPNFFKVCNYIVPGLLNNIQSRLIEEDQGLIQVLYSTFQRISLKQAFHYADNVIRGDFGKYDYGLKTNIKIYGQEVPPLYNLSAISSLNAFFFGTIDSLSPPECNKLTMAALPYSLGYEIGPKFAHVDFILAKNATHMVYEPMVKLFKHFDEEKLN